MIEIHELELPIETNVYDLHIDHYPSTGSLHNRPAEQPAPSLPDN